MKVKYASQVFSHRVSSTMRGLIKFGCGQLPPGAEDTADLLFVDKLFDSVNGSSVRPAHGKILRCAVTTESEHMEFWNEPIQVLSTMKYRKPDGTEHFPPSVKNWMETLRGFKYTWRKLNRVGFEFLCTRNLNQDPVENFFGCIRSHGARNINPTCSSFVSSFKALIVNNFLSSHSPGANCEEDETEGALQSLKDFLYEREEIVDVGSANEEKIEDVNVPGEYINTMTHSYIAGYMSRRILQKIGPCEYCKQELISTESDPERGLIEVRAYSPKDLVRPNTNFRKKKY